MFDPATTGIEDIIVSVITFAILCSILGIILRLEKLYLKTKLFVMMAISALATVRLLLPLELDYNHVFVNRGPLRHIFIFINSVWNKDDKYLCFISIRRVFFVIWLIGAIIGIIKLTSGYRKALSYISVMGRQINNELREWAFVSEESRCYIEKRKISILKLDGIGTPETCGLFKPLILIPDNDSIGEDELKVILSHEITHIKKHDLFKKLFFVVLKIVYWWFPPFGKICDHSSLIMEMSTDRRASRDGIGQYLTGIVHTMEAISETKEKKVKSVEEESPYLHPIAFFSRECDMEKRIKKLVFQNRENTAISILMLVLALFIFISSYLFSITFDHTYKEYLELDAKEGYVTALPSNTKIIKLNDGTYEEYVYFDETGYLLIGVYDSFRYLTNGAPMFNEKGEQIKWPFFHR